MKDWTKNLQGLRYVEVDYKGIKVKVLTKGQFSIALGKNISYIKGMVQRGVILPPWITDPDRVIHTKEASYSVKYYLMEEVLAVRSLIRDYRGDKQVWKPITKNQIIEIHTTMERFRFALNNGDCLFFNYLLWLEFSDFDDACEWFKGSGLHKEIIKSFIEFIYRKGDKLIFGEKQRKKKEFGEKYEKQRKKKELGDRV